MNRFLVNLLDYIKRVIFRNIVTYVLYPKPETYCAISVGYTRILKIGLQ